MDKVDVVALMLAARHEPAVKAKPEYPEAKAELDARLIPAGRTCGGNRLFRRR